MYVKKVTWSSIGYRDDAQPESVAGRRHCGFPVRGRDGYAYWVESHQWKILEDGSRELPRYRVVRLDVESGAETAYPFYMTGRVAEWDRESQARQVMKRLVYGPEGRQPGDD